MPRSLFVYSVGTSQRTSDDTDAWDILKPLSKLLSESPVNDGNLFSLEFLLYGDLRRAASQLSSDAFKIAFSHWNITHYTEITSDIERQALQMWAKHNPVIAYSLGVNPTVATSKDLSVRANGNTKTRRIEE